MHCRRQIDICFVVDIRRRPSSRLWIRDYSEESKMNSFYFWSIHSIQSIDSWARIFIPSFIRYACALSSQLCHCRWQRAHANRSITHHWRQLSAHAHHAFVLQYWLALSVVGVLCVCVCCSSIEWIAYTSICARRSCSLTHPPKLRNIDRFAFAICVQMYCADSKLVNWQAQCLCFAKTKIAITLLIKHLFGVS